MSVSAYAFVEKQKIYPDSDGNLLMMDGSRYGLSIDNEMDTTVYVKITIDDTHIKPNGADYSSVAGNSVGRIETDGVGEDEKSSGKGCNYRKK